MRTTHLKLCQESEEGKEINAFLAASAWNLKKNDGKTQRRVFLSHFSITFSPKLLYPCHLKIDFLRNDYVCIRVL